MGGTQFYTLAREVSRSTFRACREANASHSWRMPFYTIFLDRLVNGDPTNDDINGTHFEVDPLQNQLRAGGDITGLIDSLDYLQGMGIKVYKRVHRWLR